MNEHLLLQIAKKIKRVRKEHSLTVQEVATRADVSKGLISKIDELEAQLKSFEDEVQDIKKSDS